MKDHTPDDRVLPEQTFINSLSKFELLSVATKEGIWEYDFVSGKAYYNKGMRDLFGYSESDMEDNHTWWRNNIHPSEREMIINQLDALLEGEKSVWWGQYQFMCSNGTYKKVLDRLFVVRNEDGIALRLIGTMQDLTELNELQQQVDLLKKEHHKMMIKAIIRSEERERKNISEELNENINQVLATVNLMISNETTNAAAQDDAGITGIKDLLNYSINEISIIANRLSSFTLNSFGPKTALEDMLIELKTTKKIDYAIIADAEKLKKIDPEIQTLLFRIGQLQIKNIEQHSDAEKILVEITPHEETLSMTIYDDGNGADVKDLKYGQGFSYIEERVEAYGGSFNIRSDTKRKGFTLTVII
jgi:PAS domain S-box-containing protein